MKFVNIPREIASESKRAFSLIANRRTRIARQQNCADPQMRAMRTLPWPLTVAGLLSPKALALSLELRVLEHDAATAGSTGVCITAFTIASRKREQVTRCTALLDTPSGSLNLNSIRASAGYMDIAPQRCESKLNSDPLSMVFGLRNLF